MIGVSPRALRLLATAVLCAVPLVLAASAAAKPKKPKEELTAQFEVEVYVHDFGSLRTESDDGCGYSLQEGSHSFTSLSDVAALPVAHRWTLTRQSNGVLGLVGYKERFLSPVQEITQPVELQVDYSQTAFSYGSCEVNTEPPCELTGGCSQLVCGPATGMLTMAGPEPMPSSSRTAAVSQVTYRLSEDDPYRSEDGRRYCPIHALHPWPTLLGLEKRENRIRVTAAQGLRYFSLSEKEQRKCHKEVRKEGTCKADFSFWLKTEEKVDEGASRKGRQVSNIRLGFTFIGMCRGSKCSASREGSWGRVPYLLGDPPLSTAFQR